MITVNKTINVADTNVPPVISAVQGDTGRSILFSLADFSIPAGATATYYIYKPSGTSVYNAATITDGKIQCDLTAQSLAEVGDNYMQVRIISNGAVVTSFDVILDVKPFRGNEAIESTTESTFFDQLAQEAMDAADRAEEVMSSIPDDYTSLSNTVSGHTTSIGNLQTTVSGHTTDIGNLQSDVSDLNSNVSDLNSNLTVKTGTITAIGSASVNNVSAVQVGRVVMVAGYATNVDLTNGSVIAIGTISGVDKPSAVIRTVCGVAPAAYNHPADVAYCSINIDGTISVTSIITGTRAVYFCIVYVV